MKNLKFKVHSPEHSEAIQKRLFELGYAWPHNRKKVVYLEETVNDGLCTFDGNMFYNPDDEDYQEATLNDLYDPSFLIDKDALLEEARRRYPIGTNVHPVTGGKKRSETDTVLGDLFFISKDKYGSDATIIHHDNNICGFAVYYNGKWAEIVEPEEMTVEQIEKELGRPIKIVK